MKKMLFVSVISALLGANMDKIPSFAKSAYSIFEPTLVYEGNLNKVDTETYAFNDGAIFVIKDIKGMIPMNSKVRLYKNSFGNYYFETVR